MSHRRKKEYGKKARRSCGKTETDREALCQTTHMKQKYLRKKKKISTATYM
jgi:hypothetical protein